MKKHLCLTKADAYMQVPPITTSLTKESLIKLISTIPQGLLETTFVAGVDGILTEEEMSQALKV